VWKATTQLGCAWVDCAPGAIFPAKYGRTPFHVCEYYPQGNVIGYFGCVPLPYPEMREG
jgi:pathogenesis-related protein 1